MPKFNSQKKTEKSRKSTPKQQNSSNMKYLPQDLREIGKRLEKLEAAPSGFISVNEKGCTVDVKTPISTVKATKPEEYSKAIALLKQKGIHSIKVHQKLMTRDHRERNSQDVLRVKCVERVTSASLANTNLTTVSSLISNNSADAKVFAAVYDESRCTHVEVKMLFLTRNASTGVPAVPLRLSAGGVAFDPANPGVYSTIEQTTEAKEHVGPFSMNQPSLVFSTWVTKTPYITLQCKPMPNVPTSTGTLIGSNWGPSTDTTAINGYVKPFLEAVGAAVESVIDFYFTYHMEFAFRT